MLKSFVLNANKEAIILNWIKNYQWESKEISKSFQNTINYYMDNNAMCGIEPDINEADIKTRLKNYVKSFESDDTFNNFLKRIYETYPYKMSFKKFLEDNEINFNNKFSLQNFIINMQYSI